MGLINKRVFSLGRRGRGNRAQPLQLITSYPDDDDDDVIFVEKLNC
jgi:hypothetical protein